MSDKKRAEARTCGKCQRVGKRDLDRKYCPVTVQNISYDRDASACLFYLSKPDPEYRPGDDRCRRRKECS